MIIFVFQSSVVWICLSLGLVCVCTYLHGACVWGRSTQFAQISGGGQVIITEICIPFVSCVFFSHTHTPTRALWLVFQLRISHSTGIYSEFIKKKKKNTGPGYSCASWPIFPFVSHRVLGLLFGGLCHHSNWGCRFIRACHASVL